MRDLAAVRLPLGFRGLRNEVTSAALRTYDSLNISMEFTQEEWAFVGQGSPMNGVLISITSWEVTSKMIGRTAGRLANRTVESGRQLKCARTLILTLSGKGPVSTLTVH